MNGVEDIVTIGADAVPAWLRDDRGKRLRWSSLLVFAPVLMLPLLAAEALPIDIQLASIVLCVASLWPLYRWLASGAVGFPGFEVVMVAYGLNFGVATFLQPNEIVIFSKLIAMPMESLRAATMLALFGVLSTMAGHSLGQHFCRKANWRPWSREVKPRWALPLSAGLIALSIIVGSFGTLFSEAIGGVAHMLGNQRYVGLALLACAAHQGRGKAEIPLWVAVAIIAALGLATGMVEAAMMPLAIVALIRWETRKKPPVVMMLAACVAFVILQQSKLQFREEVWEGGEAKSLSDKLARWTRLTGDQARSRATDVSESEAWREAMTRFDLIHRFAHVRGMTPDIIPFFQGQTYSYFRYALIPRVFWAGKPKATDATDTLDFTYQLRSPDNRTTNIAIGILPEAYANFGAAGVGIVMLLKGVAFSLLAWFLNAHTLIGRAIYVSLVVWFFNGIGSSAVIFFGGIIQVSIATMVLVKPFLIRVPRPVVSHLP